MEFNSIDQFLDTLEGPVESSGSFRLDLDAARRKLKSFQLPDPGLYPVFLVAAATASKAKDFDVWTQPDELRFEFNGKPFTARELESLEGYLFASDEVPPRLQNLAIALTAARELADSFEFRSGVARLSWSDGVLQVAEDQKVRKTCLKMRTERSFLSKFKKREPSLKETMSVCRFAPLNVRFNKAHPGWYWSFRNALITRVLANDIRIGYRPSAYDCHRQEVESPGQFAGIIALVKESEARDLLVIVHGVAHPIPIDAPHMEGVIWHDGLTRDLSCTQLVHNEEMKEFLSQLKGQIAGMVLQRVTSIEAFRADDRAILEPLAEQAAAHYREQGDEDAAERLTQWVQVDDTDDFDLASAGSYQAFQEFLAVHGDSAQGMAVRARGLELLIGQVNSMRSSYQWEEMMEPVTRIRSLFSSRDEDLEALALGLTALTRTELLDVSLDWSKSDHIYMKVLVLLILGEWEQVQEIFKAPQTWGKRGYWIQAHAYLGRGHVSKALQAAQEALRGAVSMEDWYGRQEGREDDYSREFEENGIYRELIADCLEASGERGKALGLLIESLPSSTKDKGLQLLRVKSIKNRAAGILPFWKTLHWHARCLKAQWTTDERELPFFCPSGERQAFDERWGRIEAFLEHKDVGPVEVDMALLAGGRIATHARTTFILGRVLQEMRRRGQPEKAERLAARVALVKEIRGLSHTLVSGPREG
jgi:tetratricopeptide (TPR) repeat protein